MKSKFKLVQRHKSKSDNYSIAGPICWRHIKVTHFKNFWAGQICEIFLILLSIGKVIKYDVKKYFLITIVNDISNHILHKSPNISAEGAYHNNTASGISKMTKNSKKEED